MDWPLYEISTSGNVRRSGKPIRTFLVKGYLGFNVINGTSRKSLRVHREVARRFLPPFSGQLVRHLDGDPANNSASNLAWGTCKDNEDDKRRHGRIMIGEKHHQAKLTNEQAKSISESAMGSFELARLHGVSPQTIWSIRKGITWR